MLASPNFRKPLDFFGRPMDQVKSMFQKGVRLGNEKEALSGFFACYNLRALFPDDKNALSLQTNILNRLIICICEDICFANPALIRDALPPLIQMSYDTRRRDPVFLARVVKAAVESPKSRWCSHASAFFRGAEPPEKVDLADPACFAIVDSQWPRIAAKLPKTPFFAMLIRYHSKAGAKNKVTIARFILGLAHFIRVDSEQGRFLRNGWEDDEKLVLPEVDVAPYLAHEKAFFPDVPDYAIDMHTAKGRGMKRDRQGFRIVGAKVTNAHPLMNNELYERAYNSNQ
jgi:hypothetical protein